MQEKNWNDIITSLERISVFMDGMIHAADQCRREGYEVYRNDGTGWWMRTKSGNNIGVHLYIKSDGAYIAVNLNSMQKFGRIDTFKDLYELRDHVMDLVHDYDGE